METVPQTWCSDSEGTIAKMSAGAVKDAYILASYDRS